MKTLRTAIVAACTASMMLTAAGSASAAYYYDRYGHRHYYNAHRTYYRHTYSDRDCWAEHHQSANTGTVLGAIGGGIIGSQLAGRGSRGLGTVLGAGGGAVVGHQIGAHAHRCR